MSKPIQLLSEAIGSTSNSANEYYSITAYRYKDSQKKLFNIDFWYIHDTYQCMLYINCIVNPTDYTGNYFILVLTNYKFPALDIAGTARFNSGAYPVRVFSNPDDNGLRIEFPSSSALSSSDTKLDLSICAPYKAMLPPNKFTGTVVEPSFN